MTKFQEAEIEEEEALLIKKCEKTIKKEFSIEDGIYWTDKDVEKMFITASIHGVDERLDRLCQLSVKNNYVNGIGIYVRDKTFKFGELPNLVTGFKNLEHLVLAGGSMGVFPESFKNLKNLKALNLQWQALKELPDFIGDLKELELLNFEGNQLQALPNSIGDLKNLKFLNLVRNSIKELPQSIGNLESLEVIKLVGNEELNYFPESFKNLKNLRELRCSEAGFSELPDFIGDLSSLEVLNLRTNPLTELPESLAKLKKLRAIDLSSTKLKRIPEWVLEWTSLEWLTAAYSREIEIDSELFHALSNRGVKVETHGRIVDNTQYDDNRGEDESKTEKIKDVNQSPNISQAKKYFNIAKAFKL